jgi:anti-sigma-K factor RskA
VPIDNRIQAWTAATLPGDWRSIQSRWELWHTIRTFLSIAAVVAVTIGATVARTVEPSGNDVGRRGRAVTGGRPA